MKPRAARLASSAPATTVYPRRLLIFHSPTLENVFVATSKFSGLGLFVYACLVVAPAVSLDESNPSWMVPAVIAASATVLPILHMTTRPFVTNIFIDIPAWARRSKKTLQDFSKQLPADTTLEIETMGLLPWPRTKAVRISDLRILPQGYGRLANLEQVVPADDTSKVPKSMRWSLEQFYARPVISRWKNSRAPEVWPLVLETISMNGNAFAPGKGKPVQTMRPTPARLPRAAALRTPAVPASKQNVRNK